MKLYNILGIFIFLLCFLFNQNLSAQISFTDQTVLIQNSPYFSFYPVGIVDVNDDFLDDIVILNNGKKLTTQIQNETNDGFTAFDFGNVSIGKQWALCVADVDKNGYNDLLMGGENNGVFLFMGQENEPYFSSNELSSPSSFFTQGSNFVDINNDGFIDIFACNDIGINQIWMNNDDYTLSENNIIDMNLFSPDELNAGNYSSIWCDIDNDADLDLYISKCIVTPDSLYDPRKINQLFTNDGFNFYSETSEASNLKIIEQSWSSDFQDIDNDGDFDCVLINHQSPSVLLENDGTGFFSDATEESTIDIFFAPYQVLMRDFDNDGFVDLLITGVGYDFYHNNGDGSFTKVDDIFGNHILETFAVGDLNHDGFLDIYAGTSLESDLLFLNDGNENHFIAFELVGLISNINAIGARIEIYGDWGVQIREIRSGESYGIMNSFTQHFGIGESANIDYALIKWPSGIVDSIASPPIDQFLRLYENCNPNTPNVNVDPIALPGEIVLQATGFNPHWYDQAIGGTLLHTGNIFITEILQTTTFYVEDVFENEDIECQSERIPVIGLISATQDFENLTAFTISPNPAKDILNLHFDLQENGRLEIEIISAQGALISKKSFPKASQLKNIEFDISDLSKGIYFIRASIKQQQSTQKIIVE